MHQVKWCEDAGNRIQSTKLFRPHLIPAVPVSILAGYILYFQKCHQSGNRSLGTFCSPGTWGKERHFKVARPIWGSGLTNFSWWRKCKVGASESKTSPSPLRGVLADSPHYTSNLVSADLEYNRKSQIMLRFCKKGKIVDLSRKRPIPELCMSHICWLIFPTSKNKTLQWCSFQ